MFDGNFASRAVYKTLSDDATLAALHNGVVEDIWGKDEELPSEAFPFISISVMPQEDVYYNGHARAKTDQQVLVRGIQAYSADGIYSGTLQSIADRVDTLLHGKTIPVYDTDGETVLGSAYIYRISPFRDRYVDGSIEYRHLGGIYSVSTCER